MVNLGVLLGGLLSGWHLRPFNISVGKEILILLLSETVLNSLVWFRSVDRDLNQGTHCVCGEGQRDSLTSIKEQLLKPT